MNTLITLDQLHGMPFGQVAALSIRDLANLLDTAVRELEIAKSHKAFFGWRFGSQIWRANSTVASAER